MDHFEEVNSLRIIQNRNNITMPAIDSITSTDKAIMIIAKPSSFIVSCNMRSRRREMGPDKSCEVVFGFDKGIRGIRDTFWYSTFEQPHCIVSIGFKLSEVATSSKKEGWVHRSNDTLFSKA